MYAYLKGLSSTILFVLFAGSPVVAQLDVPVLEGRRVHDKARVLSPHTVQNLESQLKLHEDSTGNQIAILILPSLQGESIEEYALRVAHDAWKLGSEKNDNGVLLLVAIEDRKMRIEVGQGLEGVLTDALCSQIIRNEMAPRFRRGEYDAGVLLAINEIVHAIAGEYTNTSTSEVDSEMGWGERILIGVFIFGLLGMFTLAGLSSKGGCAGWFLYVFLMPFYALFPHVVIGSTAGLILLAAYIVGFPILRAIFKRKGWQDDFSSRGGSGGGWSSGSGWFSGGGGSSWGGSSGGGFSGGGGSFGGGGASGSW